MTTLGKTMFVILSLGALFGATLALRSERDAPAKGARLTPAQMAEVQPPPADPPKANPPAPSKPAEDEAPAPDLDAEDGSGS